MKRLVIISLTVLVLLLSTLTTSASPIYGEGPTLDGPTLIVQKWIDQDEVHVGDPLTVHVNITNISNDYAKNLTITEPMFNNYIFESNKNYTEYTYVSLGKGAVVYYEYDIIPDKKGDYSIEPTEIEYYSVNGDLFRAQSSYIEFSAFVTSPPQDNSELWQTVMWYSLAFAGIPIIIYYANKFLKR